MLRLLVVVLALAIYTVELKKCWKKVRHKYFKTIIDIKGVKYYATEAEAKKACIGWSKCEGITRNPKLKK